MKLSKLSSEDLKNIETVVDKVVSSKIDPFREEFNEHKKQTIEWFENIFDDLQGKHQEMRQIKAQVSRVEKISPITT